MRREAATGGCVSATSNLLRLSAKVISIECGMVELLQFVVSRIPLPDSPGTYRCRYDATRCAKPEFWFR
jgi:hypothetical protein